MSAPPPPVGPRGRLGLAGPLAAATAVVAALSFLLGGAPEALRDVDAALGRLREFGASPGIAAVGLLAADLVLPVPATAVIAALGATYGLAGGALVGSLGLVAAGALGYGLVRVLGRRAAVALAGESRLARLQAFFDRSGAWAIVLTRGLPIVPEVVACLAGLAHMRPARFFLALALGSLPMGFAYAAIGAGWRDRPSLAIAAAYLLPLLLLPWVLKLLREQPAERTAPEDALAYAPRRAPSIAEVGMDRRVVLVTGGNSGIGFECARALAREGCRVVVASRDRAASAAAVRRIQQETGNPEVSELGLDLGSSATVREFAREVESRDLPLHALVCNAGLQMNRGPVLSPDGFELTFAVNHLGHFLLVNLLLERLLAHAPARILIVSSGVHDPSRRTGMPKPDVADLETLAATGGPRKDAFDGRLAYVNSKLCNLWFAYELARRIEAARLAGGARPLSVNAFEPGLVPGSGLARDYPVALRFLWNRVLPAVAQVATRFVPTVNPAGKSGEALARLVLDPVLERTSGRYFPSHSRWREARSSDASYDVARAAELWEASVRMTRLARDESPLMRA